MEGQEELVVFDQEDLVNGIGGALGLFLGWSILYIGNILISSILIKMISFVVTESYDVLLTLFAAMPRKLFFKK